jgi:hypothetical protein
VQTVGEPLHRVPVRAARQVFAGDPLQRVGLPAIRVAADLFDIGQQRGRGPGGQAEDAVEIVVAQFIEARIVQVPHQLAVAVDPRGHDGGLDVVGPVRRARRVGQPPAVHLDGVQHPALWTGLHGLQYRHPDVLLGHLQTIETADVFGQRLEE